MDYICTHVTHLGLLGFGQNLFAMARDENHM